MFSVGPGMSGRTTRSARNTGQRKNQNVRDSDPKPKSKNKSKRGTKSKTVPKEGLLGTLFEEDEEVEESLQFLNAKELIS